MLEKNGSYCFVCIICLCNPVMKMSVGGRRGFGRRTHSKTYWPERSAIVCSPQMIYINIVSVPDRGDDHYWLWPSLLGKTKKRKS